MVVAKKAQVSLGNVPLAGNGSIVWRFTTGTAPYTAVFQVERNVWETRLRESKGKSTQLVIVDANGTSTTIDDLYILHEAPSQNPEIVSFVVADRRWRWGYKIIDRDFNVPRKTGDRTADLTSVPVETRVTVDAYDFLPYSLDNGRIWTAKRAVEDLLEQLDEDNFDIESFPIEERGSAGEFTLQNVLLRDPMDVALARLLSYIPGAEVTVTQQGRIRIFDGTDLRAAEQYFNALPPDTWDGDAARMIGRKQIRPKAVKVFYQREVEAVFDYSDDYSGTTASAPSSTAPFLQNVLPTVDPETEISEFDPEVGATVTKTVPPGTWVEVSAWLAAMDADRPAGSLPWTFDTIRRHWLKGDLEGVLGARGLDLDEDGNVALRVQALRQHFRQTFQIQRSYRERFADIRAIRVGLIDPVTGARAPAAVWGQACIVPTTKGKYMASRTDPSAVGVYRNVDYLAPYSRGERLIDTPAAPARVNLLDKELGIFRVDWLVSPYGTVESFIPCNLVGASGAPQVPVRDLSQQDNTPMGPTMVVESGTNGIFLDPTMSMRVMLTIVPAAPNNKKRLHYEEVTPSQVASLYRSEYRITEGEGPEFEVYVAPGEATARFAWESDQFATTTLRLLLGVGDPDPSNAGINSRELLGFVLMNEQRYLRNHARAVATEVLSAYADNVQGAVATAVPTSGLRLEGNMSGASIRVAGYPSARVDAVHEFPGQQKRISRFATLPESARRIVLGTVPFE